MSGRLSTLFKNKLRKSLGQYRSLYERFRHALFSWRTLVCFTGILLTILIFAAAIAPVRYDISVGMVPNHTITASRDVIDNVTSESRRNAAAQAVQPTYRYMEGVTENVLAHFDQVFAQLDDVAQYSETLQQSDGTARIYTADELKYARSIISLLDLRDYQLRTLLNTPREELTALYPNLYAALQNTLASYVTQGMESEAVDSVMKIVGYRVDTSLLQNIVQPVLRAVMQANMVIDQEATAAARQQARDAVEPVVYKQGQNILVKGEGRVERYQYEMLLSLGLLNNTDIDIRIYLGGALLVALVLSLAMVLLRLTAREIVHDYKRMILLFTILIFTLLCCIAMRLLNIYLAPAALAGMLISAMLGLLPGLICNAAMALLVSALAAGGSTAYTAEMVLMLTGTLCSGTVGAMLLYKHSNRLRVITAGLCVGVCGFAVICALELMTSSSMSTVLTNALWCLGGGVVSGILCIAAQPLLELTFNLPTPTKLMELSNPNHPLLRRLLLEAPGTYHHSIVVANLAEAAAEAIGANPLLARVGGYYHDIGKLRRPKYFKENQLGGENLLVESDPYTAAQIVISHTRDGAVLARSYHLPREVIRIILEHHGNTPVMYFYTAAVKEANGQPVDADKFRYDAAPPATKEGAIVLLCDTIEAAVRSMPNPTPDTIEAFIVKLIRGKLQDGQLSNSPLTLKDIDSICHASATVLNGVFHERIEYPDPPAELKHPAKAKKESAKPTVEEVKKTVETPWDGTPEDAAPVEASATPDQETVRFSADAAQFRIDPSEFEADAPLPVIQPPTPDAPISIESALKALDHPESSQDEPEDSGHA